MPQLPSRLTLFPKQPMIPLPTDDTLRWPTCCTSSLRAHTVRKIPTICLHVTSLYRRSFALGGGGKGGQDGSSSAPSKRSSTQLSQRYWNDMNSSRSMVSLSFLCLQLSLTIGEDSLLQLQDLRRDLFAFKLLRRTFRDGFWRKLTVLGVLVDESLEELFNGFRPWPDESEL